MKVSIVTAVFNGKKYIRSCIESILSQTHKDIEYIIVDGGSTDGTREIIMSYGDRIDQVVFEPDEGIYDAINKGLTRANGEVLGILNSDDYLANKDIIGGVVQQMKDSNADLLYGDLVMVDPEHSYKLKRYYQANSFKPSRLLFGDMPPHPTMYCRRELFEKIGYYNKEYKIGGDFEFMVRAFLNEKCNYTYLPIIMVVMRTGGVSTSGLKSTKTINTEMQTALAVNGFHVPIWKIYLKYLWKVFQLIKKPKGKTLFLPDYE